MQGRHIRGADLRSYREQACLRISELAAEVHCSAGYLINIESATDQPGAVLAHRLARALSHHLGKTITIDNFSDVITGAA